MNRRKIVFRLGDRVKVKDEIDTLDYGGEDHIKSMSFLVVENLISPGGTIYVEFEPFICKCCGHTHEHWRALPSELELANPAGFYIISICSTPSHFKTYEEAKAWALDHSPSSSGLPFYILQTVAKLEAN
jgi:hypothetical protein